MPKRLCSKDRWNVFTEGHTRTAGDQVNTVYLDTRSPISHALFPVRFRNHYAWRVLPSLEIHSAIELLGCFGDCFYLFTRSHVMRFNEGPVEHR